MPHYNFTYTKKLYDEDEVQEREAALRAELDAERAKSARLAEQLEDREVTISTCHNLIGDDTSGGVLVLESRVRALVAARKALEADVAEARELVRHSSGMRPRSLEAIIARWDAERAAPLTGRDTGDESGAA